MTKRTKLVCCNIAFSPYFKPTILQIACVVSLSSGFIFVCIRINDDVGLFYVTDDVMYEVPCDDVSLSVSEDLDMLKRVTKVFRRKGVNFCSFRNSAFVVDTVAERLSRQRTSRGMSKFSLSCGNEHAKEPDADSLAFFNVLETLPNTSNAERAEDTVLQWRRNKKRSFVGKRFRYNKGRIGVNSTDFFYVYVSLAYRQGRSVVKEQLKTGIRGRLMTFLVSIYKQNRFYPDISQTQILRHMAPVCTESDDITTVHIGSHIHLKRDDEVFVKVMDTHRLVPESTGNQFGLFVIK